MIFLTNKNIFILFFSIILVLVTSSGDFFLLFFLLFFFGMNCVSDSHLTLNWISSFLQNKNLAIQSLLFGEGKMETQFNIVFTLKSLFGFVLLMNLSGLNMFLNQMFMGKLSISLLIMAVGFWFITYSPFFFTNKEKFSLFMIGEMKFPVLSFLLSNIEILTHLFRPITLTARLWVNIWVGHLLMSALSTFVLISGSSIILWFSLGGFFFFETGIMCLQAFVFSYLISVYWKENLEHSKICW